MKKFKTIFWYIINIPTWLLSKIIKPNKNIWIFGAWFGKKYGDNSKYLFEYVNKNYPEIKAIWLTKDNATLKLLKNKGYRVYKTYSFLGYFFSLFAKYGFVSTGIWDINIFPTANMKIINLWHGIPLKKIMMDDNITRNISNNNSLYQKLKNFFFPFAIDNYYSTIATSSDINKIYHSAFRGLTKNVDLIGQPRCDAFYLPITKTLFTKKLQKIKETNKLAIYMPTHRREGKIDFSKFLIDELNTLNNKMKEYNVVLLVKLHFYHQKDIDNLKNEYSNIIFVKDEDIEQDIYSILHLTDFLITDYSSIYFDYLHTNKPIIFFAFDKEDYLKNDRAFYFDYDSVTPGEKAYSWYELYEKISLTANGQDNYIHYRQEISNRFNKYQDGRNCERVVEWIKSLDN